MALEQAFILMMAVSVVIGYLLGSINFGVVVSKGLYHEDVRTKGSGNAGTTNILRTYGKKAAALTLAGDMTKGAVAVWLCHWGVAALTGADVNGVYAGYLAAIGAVCGHLWPIWFGFKGGKGIAVAAGAILASEPVVLLALLVVFFAIALATRIVSLASVTVAILYPILTLLWSWYTQRSLLFTGVCTVLMAVLVVWMHRANIQRLLNGTEYRFGEKKKDE
ncbi:glycerol-3-phosphate 1-O-acyltransferase PlsY [Gemmiger sp. An194]|uniref:glycerol-3-phosphate 1-O-acyltransferase PlsY n=1 Tax=Gemmiger sp. An194 TaxID=1965582 RepID=UPI000B379510|nr:glycerol-3-phosphate 1-O-acyltransferase PlsY [Gemmiger sp. An194]